MEKQTNIPHLRFPDFEGEWKKKNLGAISTKIGSGSTPLGGEKSYQNDGVVFIRSQNVNNETLNLDDVVFISEELNTKMEGSQVCANDILLNITGASIGRSCVVPSKFKIGNVNQHVSIIRLLKDYQPHFLQPFLSSERGQKLVFMSQAGGGREGLNFQNIRSFKIYFPTLPEQQKIASFFTAIDQKISQLKRKKTLLEQYKKGVMQKIFSQEIRFKDDNGQEFPKWEKKRLKDAAEIKYGKDQKVIACENGQYPILGTGGLMGRTNEFLYDKPSVLIGRKGTIDRPLFIDVPFWTVDTLFYTIVLSNVNPKWLYYNLTQVNWYKYNEASGVPSLSSSTINKIPINLPSIKEQTKIANFLSSIDDKINHTQKQVEKAEVWKKGLMQQMFI